MKAIRRGTIKLVNDDCMNVMGAFPDNHFDLAVVDPPYGIGNQMLKSGPSRSKLAGVKRYRIFDNTNSPEESYFTQLARVSRNQIIWGANHFATSFDSASSCWIIWDKVNGNSCFADCELAYTSFKGAARIFRYMWNGMHQGKMGGDKSLNEERIHPTQKPVALYEWIYERFTGPNHKILDTHLGSASSAIAAHYKGLDFVGCEIDEHYFDASVDRFEQATKQDRLAL